MDTPTDRTLAKEAWDAIVRLKGRDGAEQWRNQNGIYVNGLPPPQFGELPSVNPQQAPVYEGQPLDAAQPQGALNVDETEDNAGGMTEAFPFERMTPEALSRMIVDTQGKIAKLEPVMGRADYDAAREKIMQRRYGPSRAEQLFALSAALAKPTYAGNRFGQILGNVMPTLADTERARREAEEARQSALDALKQQYLTGVSANTRAQLEGQLGVLKTAAQMAKPTNPYAGAVWDATSQRWVVRPGSAGSPPVLTPQQVAELARDPRNRGMQFFTADGRPMTIK